MSTTPLGRRVTKITFSARINNMSIRTWCYDLPLLYTYINFEQLRGTTWFIVHVIHGVRLPSLSGNLALFVLE